MGIERAGESTLTLNPERLIGEDCAGAGGEALRGFDASRRARVIVSSLAAP